MKNEIKNKTEFINNNQKNLSIKNQNNNNSEKFKKGFINDFFSKFNQIKESYIENIEELYEKVKKINIKEILTYITNLNKEQIDSIVNKILSCFVYDEKLFLIKVEENLDNININEIDNLKIDLIENNDTESKLKKIKLYYRTYILIKELFDELLIKKNKYFISLMKN